MIFLIKDSSGGSRQNVDRVLSQKNLAKKMRFFSIFIVIGNFDLVLETLWPATIWAFK